MGLIQKHSALCIKEYLHWVLLLRDPHVTFGSMILCSKDPITAFSDLSQEAQTELFQVVNDIEKKTKKFLQFEKINYLMLMMVDPEVHFHVIPRYSQNKTFNEKTFQDYSWPKPADLNKINKLDEKTAQKLIQELRNAIT